MVRIIGFFVGLAFAGVLLISLVVNGIAAIQSPAPATAEHEFRLEPKALDLPSNGPFGKFDKAQLQRGFQVYKEVCSACHALSRVHFYDLKALGYSDAAVKKIASEYQIPAYNSATGEVVTHPGIVSDAFPPVAYGGQGNPPDLSLITKAREGGAPYVYSLLTGYANQQGYKNEKGEVLLQKFPEAKSPAGLHFNPYFPTLNLAMPAPLTSDGQVTYAEGNPKPTVDQMAKDVSAFLVWTAEPKLENRHSTGLAVIIFLLFATVLGYLAYQNVWAEAKRKVAPVGPLDPENTVKRTRARKKAGVES